MCLLGLVLLGWPLRAAEAEQSMIGPSLRVQRFLRTLVLAATNERYDAALANFNDFVSDLGVAFYTASEDVTRRWRDIMQMAHNRFL